MDRYITRERRFRAEYPEGNQGIPFSTTSIGNNITMPEHVYYGTYNPMNYPETYNYHASAMMPPMQTYLPNMNLQDYPENHVMQPAQNNLVPGVDHRYLAYTDHNNYLAYTAGQANMQQHATRTVPVNTFGEYQKHNFVGADRTVRNQYTQGPNVTPKKKVKTDLVKVEAQNEVKIRAENLNKLKTTTRAFCGSIENILTWHKMIKDVGVMVLYNIVGKCVSIQPGESCAKNLVLRDENGPAIQVVYYEIDFMLPKLHVPCNVRVVGRMLPGSNRLQAFAVRAACAKDVATLARSTAAAAHHVAKLVEDCKAEVLNK